MDQVLKQLGIEWIFSAPYHPQSNSKLEGISQIRTTKTNLEETL